MKMHHLNIFILWLTVSSWTIARCDEQPIELSPGADIKKLSASEAPVAETKVEAAADAGAHELKSKDGDTLETLPSQQSDYNYVLSKPVSPINIDMGPYDGTGGGAGLAQQSYVDSQPQQQQQQQHQQQGAVVYRYSTGEPLAEQPAHSYVRQEPQHPVYEPQKTFARQPQMESDGGRAITPEAPGYRVPDLPLSQPGISTTYSSPDVKIVSHTRSFLPVVYKQSVEQSTSSEGAGSAANNPEHEYEKAVQDRPGGQYAKDQEDQGFETNDGQQQGGGAYGGGNEGYNRGQQDTRGDDEIISRGPYYHIRKPYAAHIQVIEDKDEYKHELKEQGYGGQPSYGQRTQPRPQFKNYRPSGYSPGMLSAYDPPSPPLSAILGGQGYPSNGQQMESNEDDSYDGREQSGRGGPGVPDPQALQQQPQSPQEYKQTPYGVEVEFDQNQKNEPQVLRGPGVERRPVNEDQDYNSREQDRPDYDSNRGQDYEGHNQLGPKYNVGGDDDGDDDGPQAQPYQRPLQQQQQQEFKPQSIQYGFIPLSEAKEAMGGPGGYRGPGPAGPDMFRGPPRGRPNDYNEQRPYGGPRRPFQGPNEYNGETVGVMYGRGQSNGHRGGGYDGNDIYRDQGFNGFVANRKPVFERPPAPAYDGPQDASSEEEQEEGDYGSQMKGRGPHGSGLPPGASYNPRDVGLDESVVAQLNLAASSPAGILPHGYRGAVAAPLDTIPGYQGARPFPAFNNAVPAPVAPGMPRGRPRPYSASGQGFRSQYGYRAAASELSPVSAPSGAGQGGANGPVLSNLLNLNPVKSFRSLMSYLTGGING